MSTFRHFVAVGVGAAIALSYIKPSASKDLPSLTQPQSNLTENQDPPPLVVPTQEGLIPLPQTPQEAGSPSVHKVHPDFNPLDSSLEYSRPKSPVPTPSEAVIHSASPLLRTPQNGSEPAKEDVGKPVQPLGDASVVQSPIPVIAQSRQGNQETPVPEEFNPSANPLLFPTQTEEVQIQRTQPITLQQTLELARRNNRELEAAKLTLERTQSALQEALAAEFPTAGVVADFTRTESAQSNLSNQPQDQDIVSRSFNGALQLSYDLYTAGRRSATIRAAEGQVRFQELEVESLSEQLRLNVTRAYYDLQQADAQVEISQAAESARCSVAGTSRVGNTI